MIVRQKYSLSGLNWTIESTDLTVRRQKVVSILIVSLMMITDTASLVPASRLSPLPY